MCVSEGQQIANPGMERQRKKEKKKKKNRKEKNEKLRGEVMVVLKRSSGDPGGSDIMVRSAPVKFMVVERAFFFLSSVWTVLLKLRGEFLRSLMSSGVSFGLVWMY